MRIRVKASLLTVCRVVVMTIPALLLAAFCFVQSQQWLLRYRAERLLADFQSIRLHQSTWSDAQTLMTRWGAHGHYDGQCTSKDCDYTITLSDIVPDLIKRIHSERVWLLFGRSYEWMGGKDALMRVRFVVQDGAIWRSGVWLRVDVPPRTFSKDDEYGYWIGVAVKANDSLHQRFDPMRQRSVGPWILGTDDQLARHPDYKVGRPGGCEICLSAEVTFTPAISPGDLKDLSDFNLSCITRFHRCVNIPDVLPAAKDWHLYPTMESPYQEPSQPSPQHCGIPLFAVARDANRVMLVDVLAVAMAKDDEPGSDPKNEVETAKVRLVRMMKGAMPLAAGAVMTVRPSPGNVQELQTPESLISGIRYILIPRDQEDPSKVFLNFCGVFPDSPDAQEELQKGFAQNDLLRHRDKFGGAW